MEQARAVDPFCWTAALCATALPAQQPWVRNLPGPAAEVRGTVAGAPGSRTPPATTEEALHGLADQAGLIFVGTVAAVRREDAAMVIGFRVEEGIRGVRSGALFELREWAGLWANDAARYQVGKRALLLLHTPSAAGFSSPVGGAAGVVPLQGDAGSGSVDLRWVATLAQRSIAVRPEQADVFAAAREAGPVGLTQMVATAAAGVRTPASSGGGVAWAADPQGGNVLGQDVHAIDRGLVTGLLRAWLPEGVAK